MIAIIDYGIGNIQSIKNMLLKLDVSCGFVNSGTELDRCNGVILPGVGSFDEGIAKLRNSGLIPALEDYVFRKRKPILGICLGMQMMLSRSEEGQVDGLDWIKGEVKRFPSQVGEFVLRIPHIGWSSVTAVRKSALTDSLLEDSRFYFVHSYYATCTDRSNVLLQSEYGIGFDSAIGYDNIYGVQFHPEKSHDYGLELLGAFARITENR